MRATKPASPNIFLPFRRSAVAHTQYRPAPPASASGTDGDGCTSRRKAVQRGHHTVCLSFWRTVFSPQEAMPPAADEYRRTSIRRSRISACGGVYAAGKFKSRGSRKRICLLRGNKNGLPKRKANRMVTTQHRFPARAATIAGYPTCWGRRYGVELRASDKRASE